jgi:PAN domain
MLRKRDVMRQVLTFAVLAVALLTIDKAFAQDFGPLEDNVTFQGATTLRYFSTTDLGQCANACAADLRCKAYTYVKQGAYESNRNTAVCYLSSGFSQKISHPCCMSAVRLSPALGSGATGPGGNARCNNPNGSDGCTFSTATNLDYFRAASFSACQASCAQDNRCIAWSWVKPGGFNAGDPPVCYRLAAASNIVPSKCCVAGWKSNSSSSGGGSGATQPNAVDMRGTWAGGFRCGNNQYRNTLNVTSQVGNSFSGVTEDSAPFDGRVQADGQSTLSRPSWAQEYTARVTRTATGLRFDGTDTKNPNCSFTFTK